MHVRQILTLGILLLLLAPLVALAQFPQGGGGGKKGVKGMKGDPTQMWDRMVGAGKDVWLRSDAQNGPGGTFFFDRIAQDQNITNGQITKQQFMNYMEQMRARFGQGKGPPGGGPSQQVTTAPTPDQTAQWDRDAEADFRQRDQNGDGKLNEDEMPRPLRGQLDRWDINKDGLIDLNEYKAYYRDRMTNRMNNNNQRNNVTFTTDAVVDDAPLKRPDVYRYGNMPANLPAWFTELDTDQDGQIGLYEWRKAGKSLAEFKQYDRNDDGFITADEVLRWMAKNGQLEQSPGTVLAQGAPNPPPSVGAQPNPWNGGGMGNWKGKGGFKGGGKGKGKRGGGND
jgi:Ca2+-binding EF-hand superfamily protein